MPGMPAGERRLYKWRKPHESNMGAASAHCTGSADSLLSCWRLFFEQAAWRWAPLNCVVRFNSSTGSRTTLCGPPRILAGSIRFIGYDRQRPFGPIGIGISAAETAQETMTEMLHVGGSALPHLLTVTRNGSAAALSALNIWQIPSLQALPGSAAFYVSAHGPQASQASATRSMYRIRLVHPLRHINTLSFRQCSPGSVTDCITGSVPSDKAL